MFTFATIVMGSSAHKITVALFVICDGKSLLNTLNKVGDTMNLVPYFSTRKQF
mgnify:CR=1 FL=1